MRRRGYGCSPLPSSDPIRTSNGASITDGGTSTGSPHSTGRRCPFGRHVSRLATDLDCYHGLPALKAEMAVRYYPRITIPRRPAKGMPGTEVGYAWIFSRDNH